MKKLLKFLNKYIFTNKYNLPIYRKNYKSNIVKCGRIEHNVNGIVLKFRRNILHIYKIPIVEKDIFVKDIKHLLHLIHYDENLEKYLLNNFKRKENTLKYKNLSQ